MKKPYQICVKCVMDTSDPDIEFDENGVCSHCQHSKRTRRFLYSQKELSKEIEKIKSNGEGKKYDCILGISGGVDSSMVAYYLKKLGVRPLAVHLDNGWNSEYSTRNIENVLKKLNIDLYTHVINWEEFKDIQLAFFKSSISNLEIPTDHAIGALMYNMAFKLGLKDVVHGGNINSELIMPQKWMYDCRDLKIIKAIHKKFGKVEMKTFPTLGIWKLAYYTLAKKIRLFPILNYLDYNKEEAKKFLEKEFGWQDYKVKHGESIFTRFFQNYILPLKFGIDKRRAHYSSLINSGQMTRKEALEKLRNNITKDPQTIADKEYLINKYGLKPEEFEKFMNLPNKSHKDYPNHDFFMGRLAFVYMFFKKVLTK